ncbi:hypothetical protein B0H17DRAFT_1123500 [Mycena rosella]|uniref:Uncharacterized protein n=1 Tax=Mycena rosella TaxID=1033263 RepID=A0AAD7H2D8_MYCRO|nr:hypothetical protein B0H17DRAFT_1123500 [Mycena rosella]
MHFTFSLIPLLLLSPSVLFVTAQGNDEFSSITAFFSEPLLNNVSMELMSGQNTACASASNHGCILALNVPPTEGTLYYQPHTMMPDGNYFVRVNGTVTNGDSTTPLSTASGSSTAFDIFPNSESTCLQNTWTPIRSVEDPSYKPFRVVLPILGTLADSGQQSEFTQAEISVPNGIIEVQVPKVDQLFDFTPFDRMTAEAINTEKGFNAGAQDPIRVNLTSSNAEISVLSDTFLVVTDEAHEPSCKVKKASASTARRSGAMSNGLWGMCFLAGLSLFAA